MTYSSMNTLAVTRLEWRRLLVRPLAWVLAALTLDGNFRLVVWILMGGLALKTYIHTLKQP